MARFYSILATLKTDDNISENFLVNTWHFRHDDEPPGTTPEDSANDMIDQLEEFYGAIQGVLGNTLSGSIECKAYDLAQAKPRVPILTRTITIVPGGGPLPHEMAVVLSLRGAVASGQNAKRRRGRVYLGPIVETATAANNGGVLVSAGSITAIRDAAVAAFQTGLVATDPFLAVYSPTTDLTGTLDESFIKVVEVQVDNAWDTQRRRGLDATTKVLGDLPRAG